MKEVILFAIFFLCHFTYQFYNMYLAKHSEALVFLGKQYSSFVYYSLMALLIFTPLLSLANLGFSLGFQYGHRITNDIWVVSMFFVSAQILSIVVSALVLFNQYPGKGPIAGFIICVAGLLVANLWK